VKRFADLSEQEVLALAISNETEDNRSSPLSRIAKRHGTMTLFAALEVATGRIIAAFAAAFATHNTWSTFLVGLAAAVGAGISMGFAEALSDDGSLTGRGAPARLFAPASRRAALCSVPGSAPQAPSVPSA
jgi:hypothetical protein